MITLSVLPNFKGSKSDWLIVTIISIILDSTYLVPIFSHLIK